MRAFISINIDDSTNEKISDIQNKVKDEVSAISKDFLKSISWTDKDKFHLTLFFIGEVIGDKLKEIDNCLINIGSSLNEIRFDFKCINAFPKLKYPRVLIIELLNKDKKVAELSERINEGMKNIGFVNDKLFHPHITLGRVKREHKINLTGLEKNIKSDLNFSVNGFCLMESKLKSTGAEYSVIKNYKI
ncbi:MAG: RNA 2',3'-cyclic phosphodiesterase [Ignavibacteria bacterium]|nr:RNA 2',3'-cyclic phosphodiesterase [Ignavibacteria bacterium]